MKTCTKCHQEFPATLEYFYISTGKYLRSDCKSCHFQNTQKWAKNNQKKVNKSKKAWRQKNPERSKQAVRTWTKNNKDRKAASRRKWRANRLNNGYEKYTDQDVFNKYGTDCYLCQEPIDLNIPRTEPEGLNIEHVIPIVKGGPDTLKNVRPSHRKCNLSKSDKTLEDFLSCGGSSVA